MKDKSLDPKIELPEQNEASIDSSSVDITVERSVDAQNDKEQKKVDSASGEKDLQKELNGPKGLEPTRYGDWESKGRCYDF